MWTKKKAFQWSEDKDQNDIKKKSKYEISFNFKALMNILSRKKKGIKLPVV